MRNCFIYAKARKKEKTPDPGSSLPAGCAISLITALFQVGYAIGSIAALCYFAGRIPQMYKNYKRKSLEGLSLTMFLIIISANLTYGMSVSETREGGLV